MNTLTQTIPTAILLATLTLTITLIIIHPLVRAGHTQTPYHKPHKHKLGPKQYHTGVLFQPNPYIPEWHIVSERHILSLEIHECTNCHYRYTKEGRPLYHRHEDCQPFTIPPITYTLTGGGPLDGQQITIQHQEPDTRFIHNAPGMTHEYKADNLYHGQPEMEAHWVPIQQEQPTQGAARSVSNPRGEA